MAKSLNPSFDVLAKLQPYGLKLLTEQYSLKNVSSEFKNTLIQAFTLLYNLPFELREIVKLVRKGKIVMNMRIQGYDQMVKQVHYAANRLVMGLIMGALVIAASIAYASGIGKDVMAFLGVPVFSWICFAGAGMVALLIVINDYRSGKKPRI
jgi:ubiquinone biosynthesis protein